MSKATKRVRESKPKTKTFTGCWTCRARKVKCDSTRPECCRCKKAGITCEGFGVKLYWITDEDTVAPSAIKRQAMALQESRAWSFRLDEIDKQIAQIDSFGGHNRRALPASTGPFGIFQVRESIAEEWNQEYTREEKPSSKIKDPHESDASSSDSLSLIDSEDTEWLESAWSVDSHGQLELSPARSEASFSAFVLNPRIFQDPIMDQLMENYVRNVVEVLPPLPHPENPYSSIYIPKALAGASNLSSGLGSSESELPSGNVAILNALLATSAFHLRGSSERSGSEFDLIARGFRAKAFAALQQALREPLSVEEGRALSISSQESYSHSEAVISAMLTLITMDIMEGSMSEYWIHLDGVDRVAKQLQKEAPRSLKIERLITISSFLSTVASTTSIDLPHVPWSDEQLDRPSLHYQNSDIRPGLEFTYGITPDLANFMHRTVSLSQNISYYVSKSLTFPRSLISASVHLAEDISQWSIDAEPVSSLLSGAETDITKLLAKHHILAFAHGLRVYYHTRILPCTPSEMTQHIQLVASHLIEIEEIKARAGFASNVAATITWPGFIASCEAEQGTQREIWYRWWNRMLKYRIGSISQLWAVVQEAWALRDKEGLTEVPAWVPVLRRSGKRILAV